MAAFSSLALSLALRKISGGKSPAPKPTLKRGRGRPRKAVPQKSILTGCVPKTRGPQPKYDLPEIIRRVNERRATRPQLRARAALREMFAKALSELSPRRYQELFPDSSYQNIIKWRDHYEEAKHLSRERSLSLALKRDEFRSERRHFEKFAKALSNARKGCQAPKIPRKTRRKARQRART